MKVHIPKGNSKVGKVPNVSMRPIIDCGNCKHCSKSCYALRLYRMYPNVRQAWNENSRIARNNSDMYFGQIYLYLEEKRPRMFRWHVAGDILNQAYLNEMAFIARSFPHTKFLCFTKMFCLDYSRLPENLQVVFSRWSGDATPENPASLPYAWCKDATENRIPENAIECMGNCETCGMCWSLSKLNKDVYFNIH